MKPFGPENVCLFDGMAIGRVLSGQLPCYQGEIAGMGIRAIGVSLVGTCLTVLPVLAAQSPPGQGVPREETQASLPSPASNLGSQYTYTLPAGTIVLVRLTDPLSSERNKVGDSFITVLEQPLVAQGLVVSGRGQTVMGRVGVAQNAGRVQGVSQLGMELTEVVLADGQQVPIRTQLIRTSAGTSKGRDAAGIGATTGMGAMIGAAAGGGPGAAIGAAAGAVAGVIGVLSTRGRATEIYPETLLTFRLTEPLTISTAKNPQAFRVVSKQDYLGGVAQINPPRYPALYSAPPPRPYYYPAYPYYPGLYAPPGYGGYYGIYGYGPTIVFGYRGHWGHGYHHH